MRKFFFLIFLLFYLVLLAQEDEEKKPKAVFVEENFDAGEVIKGTKVSHTFKIKNEGNAPLKILSAQPG